MAGGSLEYAPELAAILTQLKPAQRAIALLVCKRAEE